MNKTEYVIAGAGMRNSAKVVASVSAIDTLPAWVVSIVNGQKCIWKSVFQSVFNSFNIKSSSDLAGLLFVTGKEDK